MQFLSTFQVWQGKRPIPRLVPITREQKKRPHGWGWGTQYSLPFDLDFASQSRQVPHWWAQARQAAPLGPSCCLWLLLRRRQQARERSGLRSSRSPGCMLRAESREKKRHTASYRAFVGSSHKGVRNSQILNVILKVEPTGIVRELIGKMARG